MLKPRAKAEVLAIVDDCRRAEDSRDRLSAHERRLLGDGGWNRFEVTILIAAALDYLQAIEGSDPHGVETAPPSVDRILAAEEAARQAMADQPGPFQLRHPRN